MSVDQFLLVASLLTIGSIFSSKLSSRLGVPALLLFLAVGMLAGSEGPGGIPFENADLARILGEIALIYILFAGGLDTAWEDARSVFAPGIVLATLGVALTALLLGGFCWLVLGFDPLVAMLLGSIVSSTDAAAVFATFAGKGVRLKGRLRALLEFESGSNDPMAVFLTIGVIQAMQTPDQGILGMLGQFVTQMGLGLVMGAALGRASNSLVNRVRLDIEGLYLVLTLALAPLIYSLTTYIGGNGFLAVYVAGLVMVSRDMVHRTSIIQFHDGLSWLMQITMFVTMGLLVYPSHLIPVLGQGMLVAGFLILVARPVSVYLTLIPTAFTFKEQTLISWVGLRGAVPIILATFPLSHGVDSAEHIFNLVFFVVLTSALIQGGTIVPVARLLGLEADPPTIRPVEATAIGRMVGKLDELTVAAHSPAVGQQIVDLDVPRHALILLIFRGEGFVLPRGTTILEAGDRLMVLAQRDALHELAETVGALE